MIKTFKIGLHDFPYISAEQKKSIEHAKNIFGLNTALTVRSEVPCSITLFGGGATHINVGFGDQSSLEPPVASAGQPINYRNAMYGHWMSSSWIFGFCLLQSRG
jgi:hypothetical protein